MFPLLRYFSVVSAVVTIIVTGTFVIAYRAYENSDIVAEAEADNETMARTLANVIWSRYGERLMKLADANPLEIGAYPVIDELQREIMKFKNGLPIIKTKIYLADGLVVFSSAAKEIGGNRRTSHFVESQVRDFDKVIAAGRPLSRQMMRSSLNTRFSEKRNIEVVSSYIPLFGDANEIQGIVEVYSDVTGDFALVRKQSYFVAGLVVAAFSVTYLLLLLLVMRADRTIKCQYKKLEDFNGTLETKVAERSAAAEMAAGKALFAAD